MIRVKNLDIANKNHKIIDFLNTVGKLNANLYTGRLEFSYDGPKMGENTFYRGLKYIYRSDLLFLESRVGSGWKLNCQEYVFPYNSSLSLENFMQGDYVYIDEDGDIHRFIKGQSNNYFDKSGLGLKLIVPDVFKSEYTLIDSYNNSKTFNKAGHLVKRVRKEKTNVPITTVFEYNKKNQLEKIYDKRSSFGNYIKKYLKMTYDDKGNLKSISSFQNGTNTETSYCGYENGKLSYIATYVSDTLESAVAFNYDEKGYLTKAGTISSPLGFEIGYKDGKVKNIYKVQTEVVVKKELEYLTEDLFVGQDNIPTEGLEEAIVGKTKANETSTQSVCPILGEDKYVGENIFIREIQVENEKDFINSYDKSKPIIERVDLFYKDKRLTQVINEKNIKTNYYFNQRGMIVSIFEEDNQGNLLTYTKDSGISIMVGQTGSGINKTPIIKTTSNKKNFLDGGDLLNGVDKNKVYDFIMHKRNEGNQLFTISFWLKYNDQLDEKDHFVSIQEFTRGTIVEKVKIDRKAPNVWQYVTIPITKGSQSAPEKISITLESTKNFSYEISNLRIDIGIRDSYKLLGEVFGKIEQINEMHLVKTNNTIEKIDLSGDNFILGEELINNMKNLERNYSINFYYNNFHSVIQDVKEVRLPEKFNNEFMKLYLKDISHEVKTSEGQIELIQQWLYDKTKDEFSEKNMIYQGSKLNSLTIKTYDSKDRLVEEIDSNNIVTVYKYDSYGNLLSKTSAEKKNYDSLARKIYQGREKITFEKMYNGHGYDDVHEMVNLERLNGIEETKYTYDKTLKVNQIQIDNLNKTKIVYDNISRVKEVYSMENNKKIFGNKYEYDKKGRLNKLTDSDQYFYERSYDDRGMVNEYSYGTDGQKKELKSKKNLYALNNEQYAFEEDNYQTSTKFKSILDENGNPMVMSITPKNSYDTNVYFTYQKQGEIINEGLFSSKLNESKSLAKLKTIADGFTKTTQQFHYNDRNELSGYQIKDNQNKNLILIDKMYQDETKYQIGRDKYKLKVEHNTNLMDQRIDTIHYFKDPNEDNVDHWAVIPEFKVKYEYHDLLGKIKKITNDKKVIKEGYLNRGEQEEVRKYENVYENLTGRVDSKEVSLESYRQFDNEGDIYEKCHTKSTNLFKYTYDKSGNILSINNKASIISTNLYGMTKTLYQVNKHEKYEYDLSNRIKTEENEDRSIRRRYYYTNDYGSDINRITKVVDKYNSSIIHEEFKYDTLNRLSEYHKEGLLKRKYVYKSDTFLPESIIFKNGDKIDLSWERDQLLSQYGKVKFIYDHNQVRYSKTTETKQITYLYDGNKLLGEDHSDGTKMRYFYDQTGIMGIEKIKNGNQQHYMLLKDEQENIKWIIKDYIPIVEYNYDIWGNHSKKHITEDKDDIINLNPFRFKSQYYDEEIELYYNNQTYYDPKIMQNLNPKDIEEIFANASDIFEMNMYHSHGNNPGNIGIYYENILSGTEFSVNDNYDPDEGKTWIERNFKKALRWFLIAVIGAIVVGTAISGYGGFSIALIKGAIKAGLSSAFISGTINAFINGFSGRAGVSSFVKETTDAFVNGFIICAITFSIATGISQIRLLTEKRTITSSNTYWNFLYSEKDKNKLINIRSMMYGNMGDHVVYLSKTDPYTGMTKRFAMRYYEHDQTGRKIFIFLEGLSKNEARVFEQAIITKIGRINKGTGPLKNIINSISYKNELYLEVIKVLELWR